MELEAAIRAFLIECRVRAMSPGSVRGYGYDLGRLQKYLTEQNITQVEDVKTVHLWAFLDSLGVSSRTMARYLACMRSFFHGLAAMDVVPKDPTTAMRSIVRPAYVPRPAPHDQLEAAIDHVADPAVEALFALMYETGIRVSEALALQIENVNFHGSSRGHIRISGKGKHDRLVPLSLARRARPLLAQQIGRRAKGYVFVDPANPGCPFTYDRVRAAWNRACSMAGLGRIRMHQMRHTFATTLIEADVPLLSVQRVMGHSKPEFTMVYIALSDSQVDRDIDAAARRLRGQAGQQPRRRVHRAAFDVTQYADRSRLTRGFNQGISRDVPPG